MSVAGKLFVILAFVAVVPLGVSAYTTLGTYETALDKDLGELHHRTAEYGARTTASAIETTQRTIRGLAQAIPWSGLSAEERQGALLLVFEQLDDVAAVALLDEHGAPAARLVSVRAGVASRHPVVGPDLLETFVHAVATAGPHAAVAAPIANPDAHRAPLVPIALPVTGPNDAAWTLAVGLSLHGVCDELAATTPPGVTTRLVDGAGTLLCGAAAGDGEQLRATATTAQGWSVIVEQPAADALAPVHRIRWQTLLWLAVGVLGALGAGLVLTQAIRRPLRRLTAGAEALASGKLDHRVAITSNDELGVLAVSFNHMSDAIEKQTAEIKTWNAELQQRVDARTAELKQAQHELLESRKLGAVAALGAGIAHEINNPLTGVLGMTQLLLARKDTFDERAMRNLATIEREALRVREIIERMQTLSQDTVRDAVRVDLATIVDAVAAARSDKLAAARVEVERAYAPGVPSVLGNATQLEHAISQLIDNSIKAMPSGGRLRLAVRSLDGELVAVDVEDTGRGIAPELLDKIFEPFFTTKDDWRSVGLGLTMAHRIVEVHRGRIRAASQVGTGTTMTVTLPAARHGAHLS